MPEKKKFDFTNKLMFAIVMRDEKLCMELLERILDGRKISKIKFQENELMDTLRTAMDSSAENKGMIASAEVEKTIITGLHTKSVRLDVLFQDDEAWYDIEMQVECQGYLPQRSRYYHAAMTIDSTAAGTDYRDLKKSYVIFICMFDYFKKDESVYTIRMREEQNGLYFEDGQTTILVNMKCPERKVNEKLRSFYAFVNQGEVDQTDPFIQMLQERMESANRNQEVYQYMTLDEEYRYYIEKLKKDNLVSEATRKEIEADLQRRIEALKQAEADLKQTEAELKQAEAELKQTEADLKQTEADLKQTEADLKQTEVDLKQTEVDLKQTEAELKQTEVEKQQAEAFNKLTAILLEQNQIDQLKKAMADEVFAQNLMEEYQLKN